MHPACLLCCLRKDWHHIRNPPIAQQNAAHVLTSGSPALFVNLRNKECKARTENRGTERDRRINKSDRKYGGMIYEEW